MALLSSFSHVSSSSLFFISNQKNNQSLLSSSRRLPSFFFSSKPSKTLHFSLKNPSNKHSTIRFSSRSDSETEPEPDPNSSQNPNPDPNSSPSPTPLSVTDEWGEKTESESEPESDYPKAAKSDPPENDDEWEEEYAETGGNGTTRSVVVEEDDSLLNLKRCLVDTVYGTNLGFGANSEIRAEVLELVNQLEAKNPNRAPVEAAGTLDGNWVLVYTAFSELLPLLAAGATPLLKVERISQTIDTNNLSIVNSTTLSNPFANFSFSASASFEVRSPSRIQVEFKEGTVQPPEIKPRVDLPESVDLFGQKINLSPVQQSLSPLQEVATNIGRTISGQPPLKIPIPGNRTTSWLLITYLDDDLRISRGDGGLFVLVKEGSPLLSQ